MKLLGNRWLYSSKTLNEGKEAFEDLILAVPWFDNTPDAKPGSWVTETSYDATQALIKAITDSSPDVTRENVLKNLRSIKLPASKTSGYPLEFDENGDRIGEPILVQVKNGRFEAIENPN